MAESITLNSRRPSRGRSIARVAFLFGLTGRASLPGPALRTMLGDLGIGQDAARALLARMCRHGQLTGERRGRVVDYRLEGEFARDFERIRTQSMAQPLDWPGHFHALLHQVPESLRDYRDALRRAAVLTGYGVLQPGVLICTTDRSAQLGDLLAEPPDGARVWTATLGMDLRDAGDAAQDAWDLPDLAERYRDHVRGLDRAGSPGPGDHVLNSYAELLLPALTDTAREPRVPQELLASDWPGPDLRRAMEAFSQSRSAGLTAYVASALGEAAVSP